MCDAQGSKLQQLEWEKTYQVLWLIFFDSAGFLPLKQCFQMCACCNHKWSFQKIFPRFLNADHNRKGILYLNFRGFLVVFLIHIKELWLGKKKKLKFVPFFFSSVTFLKANHSSWSMTSKTSWFTFKCYLSFTFLIKGEWKGHNIHIETLVFIYHCKNNLF